MKKMVLIACTNCKNVLYVNVYCGLHKKEQVIKVI